MFWGSFSYDYKGPCHVYHTETAAERVSYQAIIDQYNAVLLPYKQQEWACLQAADTKKWQDLGRKKPGTPAKWEVFWKKHMMKREQGKGGVDFMRYNQEVIVPLVIPFMDRLNALPDLPPFVFQQDNAPSHISQYTLLLLEQQGYIIHEHPGNSPDMSAIEQAWMPMRIAITNIWNRPHTLEWTERAWHSEWAKINQDTIRGWVSRQMEINQRILEHEGGNEFHG
jgi:hypothetical protein